MSDRALTRLAWSLCALTLLILASSLLLILLGWSAPLPQGATPWRDRTLSLVGIVGAPILGGLIASRRPAIPTDGCGSASDWASPYNTWSRPTPPTRGLVNQEPSWLP